ncbi:hypothetical protein ACLOJK_025514 [Asimina triloba]
MDASGKVTERREGGPALKYTPRGRARGWCVEMGGLGTRKKVQRKFKIRGYALKVDALDQILSFLSRFPDAEDEALDLLLDEIDKESLKSSILDKESVHRVVSLLLEADAAVETNTSSSNGSALRIIDAFVIPKFSYDPIKKVFYEHAGKLPIHGDSSAKAALYRERYQLLLQRLSRDRHFSKPAFDAEMTHSGNCEITSGFFAENTVIVAEGELLPNGIFQGTIVYTCGFPPLEDRDSSLAFLVGLDFFGGGSLSSDESLRLAGLEKKAVNDMFVILSDVWLDSDEKTMEKLAAVLDGYESVEVVPSLFVLMGNFCSRPCNLAFNSFSSLRSQFGKLGEMIGSHPRLKDQSRFLIMPGPDDAGGVACLSNLLSQDTLLETYWPISYDEYRIKFYTQEIVFFRQDLLYRMRRSCLIPPSKEETNDPFEHLVATITHQSHLCPLPLTVQPIIWNYDHCLRLYPTPHAATSVTSAPHVSVVWGMSQPWVHVLGELPAGFASARVPACCLQGIAHIVLGDRSEQKAFKYTGIACFNPGSFANDSTFVAYRPCTQEVELPATRNGRAENAGSTMRHHLFAAVGGHGCCGMLVEASLWVCFFKQLFV